MRQQYRHRQIGWVTMGSVAAGVLLVAPFVAVPGAPFGAILVAAILVLAGSLFSTLTVTVDSRELRASFTFGLVRRRVALTDVRDARAVGNPWYYGWGIHRIPEGWIWNVSGWQAVELRLPDGQLFRLGTDEPQVLLRALERFVQPPVSAPLRDGPTDTERRPTTTGR